MITETDYFRNYSAGGDHRTRYGHLLTEAIKDNSAKTIASLNRLFEFFGEYRTLVSGWRPAPFNESIKGADPNSPHVTGEGADIEDFDQSLILWVVGNPQKLIDSGFVAIENPRKTPSWLHVQTRPPLEWQQGPSIFLASAGGYEKKDGTRLDLS